MTPSRKRDGRGEGAAGAGLELLTFALERVDVPLVPLIVTGTTGTVLLAVGVTRQVLFRLERRRRDQAQPAAGVSAARLAADDARLFAGAMDDFLTARHAAMPPARAGIGSAVRRLAGTDVELAKAQCARRTHELFERHYRTRGLAILDEAENHVAIEDAMRRRVDRPNEEQIETLPALFRELAGNLDRVAGAD